MVPRKLIAVFFLKLLVVYGLLMAPWPGLQDAYRRFFHITAQTTFGSFGSQGTVEFRPIYDDDTEGNDLGAILEKKGVKGVAAIAMRTRFVGYISTAVIIALVLATPIPWRRRARALLLGLVLVHLFIAVKLVFWLLDGYTEPGHPLALYAPSPFWKSVIHETNLELTLAPATSYIVPVFIWIVATFTRKELARLPEWAGFSVSREAPAPAEEGSTSAPSSKPPQKPRRSRRRR